MKVLVALGLVLALVQVNGAEDKRELLVASSDPSEIPDVAAGGLSGYVISARERRDAGEEPKPEETEVPEPTEEDKAKDGEREGKAYILSSGLSGYYGLRSGLRSGLFSYSYPSYSYRYGLPSYSYAGLSGLGSYAVVAARERRDAGEAPKPEETEVPEPTEEEKAKDGEREGKAYIVSSGLSDYYGLRSGLFSYSYPSYGYSYSSFPRYSGISSLGSLRVVARERRDAGEEPKPEETAVPEPTEEEKAKDGERQGKAYIVSSGLSDFYGLRSGLRSGLFSYSYPRYSYSYGLPSYSYSGLSGLGSYAVVSARERRDAGEAPKPEETEVPEPTEEEKAKDGEREGKAYIVSSGLSDFYGLRSGLRSGLFSYSYPRYSYSYGLPSYRIASVPSYRYVTV